MSESLLSIKIIMYKSCIKQFSSDPISNLIKDFVYTKYPRTIAAHFDLGNNVKGYALNDTMPTNNRGISACVGNFTVNRMYSIQSDI